ncbi:hypothetical protein BKP56_04155 [Marinilactibacillus sp. 15R]|uniref:GNAT family N-acetyltransferase n=1 Tax=Marinilactibacillus sp. 15R TaxID=1911586 RepID=UPI000909749F|nr:GNAT family N-acetyltransferase [Marinilactibacillus sp. 15R]API88541.1 hypothetical protein BKP56_04155 [Marinilactibacillus sp. 15R]
MSVKIRKIEKKDNQIVGEIVQASLESKGLAVKGTAYYDPYLFDLFEVYQKPNACYWVLEKDGKVIGGGGVGPFASDKNIGELQKLYIIESEQGHGYAHLIMEKALEFAKQYYEKLYIETFASLDKANKLYMKYGFNKINQPLEGTEHSACNTWLLKKLSE